MTCVCMFNHSRAGEVVGNVTTVGIDLAKNVLSVHGVDASGREGRRRTVRRQQLTALVARWPPCLIGLEACSGAHEWARRFSALGHTVRLIAPAARAITDLLQHVRRLEQHILDYERELVRIGRCDARAERVQVQWSNRSDRRSESLMNS